MLCYIGPPLKSTASIAYNLARFDQIKHAKIINHADVAQWESIRFVIEWSRVQIPPSACWQRGFEKGMDAEWVKDGCRKFAPTNNAQSFTISEILFAISRLSRKK